MSPARDPALVASDPAVSAWVGANAGSGKTYVLTSRVIRLLLDGSEPGRLLCLTYTKAAAAEMRARVFKTLGEWATAPEGEVAASIARIDGRAPEPERLARARRLFAVALETPGGLKIETIHAFCQRLIGRFPIEAGVSAPFAVLDDLAQAELRARARAAVLTGEASEAALRLLAPHLDEARFDGLFGGEATRYVARARIACAFEALGVAKGATREAALAALALSQAERAEYARAAEALRRGGKTDGDCAGRLTEALSAASFEAGYGKLLDAFLTQGKDGKDRSIRQKLPTQAVTKASPWMRDWFDREARRWEDALERVAAVEAASVGHAMLTLSAAVRAEYRRLKRIANALDFDDLIEKAKDLLTGSEAAAWALYKLDGGLDHVLIDEAQDTSPEQWAVVSALAEEFFAGAGARQDGAKPRTVFAVGDEKQSIFSFQGADPAVFAAERAKAEARAAGAGLAFERPVLQTSRRSAPEVLRLVDAVFACPILSAHATRDPWAAHEPHRTHAAGRVEIWPLAEPEDEAAEEPDYWTKPVDAAPASSPAARLAAAIVAAVKGWIGKAVVEGESGPRPMRAGDVLILVQRRKALARALLKTLKAEGVAVAGADRVALLGHIAVKDLIAAGRFALMPGDDLTLAALLKSPIFGFDDAALFPLAYGRGRDSLWERVNAAAAGGIEGADAGRAAAAAEALRDLLDRAADPPFAFYAWLLAAGGARRKLVGRLGAEAEDVIDEFLSLAARHEQTDPPSLEGFLHAVERIEEAIKREQEEAGQGVRVLTVHGAKGLEAPVVILADTLFSGNDDPPMLLPYGGGLVWKGGACRAAREAKQAYAAAREAERARLLYVALTRARDRLVICGARTKRSKVDGTWYAAALAGFERLDGCRTIETPLGPGRAYGCEDGRAADGDATTAEPDGPLPEALTRALPPEEAPAIIRPSRLTPHAPNAGRAAGLARGRLVHRLLQSLPDVARARRAEAARAFLAARGRSLDAADREAIAARVLAILDDPAFADAFAPGSRAEVPIAGRVPELGPDAFVTASIDRLAIGPDRILIVDYKTDRAPPEAEADAPEAYRTQLAVYRAALTAAFPGRAIDCALLWTEVPSLMPLSPATLDAAFARARARL